MVWEMSELEEGPGVKAVQPPLLDLPGAGPAPVPRRGESRSPQQKVGFSKGPGKAFGKEGRALMKAHC
jgi:hypothetical protein